MSRTQRFRLAVAVLLVAGVVIAAGAVFWTQWLDPGDKGDTSTDLVTPTIAAATARVFDVSPAESQVDFLTEVSGVDVAGVFPVTAGTITLEPVGDELRVLVFLEIHVDAAETDNVLVTNALRGTMKTGDYPLAVYVATSTDLVPITEEEISFTLAGELDVHNQAAPHRMTVQAQRVGSDMWAVATSDLDLGLHGVTFPPLIDSETIQLTARLQAYESDEIRPADDLDQ
jgi:hypothetical protein